MTRDELAKKYATHPFDCTCGGNYCNGTAFEGFKAGWDARDEEIAKLKAERDFHKSAAVQYSEQISLLATERDHYRLALEQIRDHNNNNWSHQVAKQALYPAATGQPEKPPLVPLDECRHDFDRTAREHAKQALAQVATKAHE